MDLNFDSFLVPKTEPTNELRMLRLPWNSEMTMKLIETLETECHELWNVKHAGYKDKAARQSKLELLADKFGTTCEEINRKIHNLRTQYNNELRKLKKRQEGGSGGQSSGWEYFEALSFLKSPTTSEPMSMSIDPLEMNMNLDPLDSVNIALAEFQADEEREFGIRARASSPEPSTSGSPGRKKPTLRVAASAPPPLPPRALPIMWPDQPRIQPSSNADECQIFGDFVASELRTLRSNESRKKLKRMIQKAILQIGEEEDVNMFNS